MARRPRIRLPGVPQHILQRGNNRLPSFFAPADYLFYLECLRRASCTHDCAIHAYVLMTNHVHLLATPNADDSVSAMMQDVGRRYVQYVNHTYRRTGTLWEGRYKATLVDTTAYFLTCSMYIELNPVRAHMVALPADYHWSSYRFHTMGETNELLTPHAEYLALGSTTSERHRAYQALIDQQIEDEQLDEIRESTNKGWPLGTERFKADIEATLARAARPPKRGRPKAEKTVG